MGVTDVLSGDRIFPEDHGSPLGGTPDSGDGEGGRVRNFRQARPFKGNTICLFIARDADVGWNPEEHCFEVCFQSGIEGFLDEGGARVGGARVAHV